MTHPEAITDILAQPVDEVARHLLECELVRTIDGRKVRVKIVETESYDQHDAASHSYKGRTPRTDVMFGPSGHLYVYFTYGMHYCCNIVTGKDGISEAVLIRAVEPLEGVEQLEQRRSRHGIELTNGPAKLCKALDIDRSLNGHDLRTLPLELVIRPAHETSAIVQTTRIGISVEKDRLRRFYLKDNPYVSRV